MLEISRCVVNCNPLVFFAWITVCKGYVAVTEDHNELHKKLSN